MPIDLKTFRAQYPQYAEVADADLADGLYKKFYAKELPRADFNKQVGYEGLDKSADSVGFFEAVQAGIENLGGAGDSIKAGFFDLLGNDEGEAQGVQAYKANQERVGKLLEGATDWRDITNANSIGEGFGRTLDFVKEQFGLNSPQMALIMAGGLGTAAIAPNIPHPLGLAVSKAAGFTIGATAVALPMFTGWNVGRQIDEGRDPDIVKAGAMAIPQAVTEALIGKVFSTTGLGTVGKSIFGKSSEKMIGRVGQKIGEALAVGIPGEVIQQGFERASADLKVNPFESEEAATEYLDTAIAAAAALAPMGTISAIPDTSGLKGKSKEQLEAILKEDIANSPVPKSNAIKTTKEAIPALKSLGINPDIFTPEGQIKAANVMVDRIDTNRMKFLELNGFKSDGPVAPRVNTGVIPQMLMSGTAIPSRVLESTSIPELAQYVKPKKPRDVDLPVGTVLEDGPSFDLDAPTVVLKEQARVTAQRRQNSYTAKFDPKAPPPTPTLGDLPGAIVADAKRMGESLKDVLKLSKDKMVEVAKAAPFNIPEADLKDTTGKYITKDKLFAKIASKRAETWAPLQVPTVDPSKVTVQPLQRVSESNIEQITQNSDVFLEKAEVVSKFKPVLKQLQRVAKETKTKFNFEKHLKVDPTTGKFKSPMRAAQVANFIFTSVNFKNVNDESLMEAWQYYYDNLSDAEVKALEKDLDTIKKDFIKTLPQSELWFNTTEGLQEFYTYMFTEYANGVRSGKPSGTAPITPALKSNFDKLIKTLTKSKEATKGIQVSTFEDVFPQVSIEGVTPRDAVFDSVQRLRTERLRNLAEAIQTRAWGDMDKENIRSTMDEAIKITKGKEALKKAGLYARKFSMFTHLASNNKVASIVYGMRQAQETLQQNYLTHFHDSGKEFFSAPNEMKIKAAEVLDHLRGSKQKLERAPDGSIMFQRGDKMISIKNPEMIETIESLDRWSKSILGVAESKVIQSIDKLLPGTLMKPLRDIKDTLKNVKETKELNDTDIAFLESQVEVLDNIQALKSKVFVPRMRFGSYGFTAHLKANIGKNGKVKPNTTPAYHAQVEKGKHNGRYNKLQWEKAQEDLKKFKNDPDYVVFEDSKDKPYEMTYDNIYAKLQNDNITLELLAGLIGADKSEDYFINVKEEIDRKVKYQGFQKRFAESEDVPGYSTDWIRVLNAYNMGAAHFFSKQEYAPMMNEYSAKVQKELGDDHKWLKDKVNDYVEYTNSPHDSFQTIRTINFLWTMGGNVSSALLQTMTLPTTTLGSMTQFDTNLFKNAGRIAKYSRLAFKEFPGAESSLFKDGVLIFRLDDPKLLSVFRDKYKMSEAQIRANAQLFRDGRSGSGMLQEQTGSLPFETRSKGGELKQLGSKASNFVGIPISAMEQATRFVTFNAHYEMFAKNPSAVKAANKILKDDHRFQMQLKVSPKGRDMVTNLALFGMDEAHAVFGKVGRSDLQKNALGAFAFPFMTYPQNAVEFLSRMYGRGPEGKKALATTLGMFFLFSGLIGLPGGELLKELLEEAYKATAGEEIDLEQLIREELTDLTGGPRAGMFVTQGLFRATLNMDISRRIGLPIVGQDILLAAMGVRGDMTDLLGVQGSILTNTFEAWNAYKTDESGTKIASLLSPTAVSNILKAYNYSEEGVRTAKGVQLVDKEDINILEVFMRAVGITTGRIASAREEQYWSQTEDKQIKPKMESFRKKGKTISVRIFRAEKEGKTEEADKLRKQYQDLTQQVQEYLAEKNPYYDMGAFHKAVLDSVDQSAFAGVRLKDYNKENRGDAESIRKASGKDMYSTKE